MLLEQLKKKEFTASIPALLLKLILGIGLVMYSGIFQLVMGPEPITHLDAESLTGEYVSYDLWISFDCFAEMITTTENDEISEFMDYLVLVEEDYYLAVRIYPSEYEEMQKLTEESLAWINYETDDLPQTYSIQGVVCEMEEDELSYFYDYIGLSSEEAEAYGYLPLVIDTSSIRADGMDSVTSVIIALLGGACLLWAVWSMHTVLSSRHHQELAAYLKDFPEKEEDLQKWMETETAVHGVRMNQDWCCYASKTQTRFELSNNILWVYPHVTHHKVYFFIPAGKSYALVAGTREGKFWTIPMRSEAQVRETMDYMFKANPGIVRGYSKELADLFSKDREAFSHLLDEKH